MLLACSCICSLDAQRSSKQSEKQTARPEIEFYAPTSLIPSFELCKVCHGLGVSEASIEPAACFRALKFLLTSGAF